MGDSYSTRPTKSSREKIAKAVSLRSAGLSVRQISEQMGIKESTVKALLTRGFRSATRYSAETIEERTIQAERLEDMWFKTSILIGQAYEFAKAQPKRNADHTPVRDDTGRIIYDRNTVDHAALEKFCSLSYLGLKIAERRSKLLGTDTVQKIQLDISKDWGAEESRLQKRLENDPAFRDQFIEALYGNLPAIAAPGGEGPEPGGSGETEPARVVDVGGRDLDGGASDGSETSPAPGEGAHGAGDGTN